MKVFEAAVFDRLYWQTSCLLPPQQHGFVRKKSISTNLLEFTCLINQILDQRAEVQVDAIYTDFTKAFDKVDHNRLLEKLDGMGFSLSLLHLFSSYLWEGKQYVTYKGAVSRLYDCPSGVPQGSNLGPYLFLLYMIDLKEYLCGATYLLYADDLKLFKQVSGYNDVQNLQRELDSLVRWSEENKIPLNISKCKSMTFSRRNRPLVGVYKIKGEELKSVEMIKDLGVFLQKNLRYVEHVHRASAIAKRSMGVIMRHSRYFGNVSTLRMLYFSLVRSHLDFASVVCDPITQEQLGALERIQKRFLRYLYYRDFRYYDYSITYRELVLGYEVTNLKIRRNTALVMLLRDLLCGRLDSSVLLGKVCLLAPIRAGRTRALFQIPYCRTTQCTNAPLNRAMALYNQILEIDQTLDIFFESRGKFMSRVIDTLWKINGEGVDGNGDESRG